MKMRHGWNFPDADEFMVGQIAPDGSYQLAHLEQALTHVTDWSVACDAGAHVGTWTRILSMRFESVIAVEPAGDTFEALTANMQAFGCANVDLCNVALGAAPGSVSLALDAVNEQRQNTGARYVQPHGDTVMVAIDGWHLPALGFLKLDIEGSELAALLGARETIRRCRPVVLFEEKGFGVRLGSRRGQSAALLKTFGYRQLAVISSDQIWGPA